MDAANFDLITTLRRENSNKVASLRATLRAALREKCIELGGHVFDEWLEDLRIDIGGQIYATHNRMCEACHYCELKNEGERLDGSGKS